MMKMTQLLICRDNTKYANMISQLKGDIPSRDVLRLMMLSALITKETILGIKYLPFQYITTSAHIYYWRYTTKACQEGVILLKTSINCFPYMTDQLRSREPFCIPSFYISNVHTAI